MSQSKSPLTVDAILVPSSPLNRGRPSKPQQLNIVRTLREFFAQGVSATFASQKTGHDIKTVTKYYTQFMEDILEGDKRDLEYRTREEIIQVRLASDEIIHSLYQDKKEIDNMIKQAKMTGDLKTVPSLYRTKLKINQDIYDLALAKNKMSFGNKHKTWLEEFEERQAGLY